MRRRLNELLFVRVAGRAIIRVQNPAVVGTRSEPQPDLTVLERRDDFFAKAHPRSHDILLLVEVADTSMAVDRRVKVPIYAEGGISECWLVDLNAEVVEVYRRPVGGSYEERRIAARGDTVSPVAFPDVAIAVTNILGPPS